VNDTDVNDIDGRELRLGLHSRPAEAKGGGNSAEELPAFMGSFYLLSRGCSTRFDRPGILSGRAAPPGTSDSVWIRAWVSPQEFGHQDAQFRHLVRQPGRRRCSSLDVFANILD
jgi:hypothetical protein